MGNKQTKSKGRKEEKGSKDQGGSKQKGSSSDNSDMVDKDNNLKISRRYTAHKYTADDFELLKVVGKGSFGKVLQVRKRDDGNIYAMKVLKKEQLLARKQIAHTRTERKILEQIDHPFITSLKYAFQTEAKLYMILEYFAGGELFFHLKQSGRFSEERAKFYAAEIAMALSCLHENFIIYRDLKPENILLDEEGHIRLADFGLSKDVEASKHMATTFCGTPEYLAPEVIQSQPYTYAVDWWSLGTLLYEMLTGLPPYYDTNVNLMYEKVQRAKLVFPSSVSKNARDLLIGLLNRDPKKRLGSGPNGATDIQNHPFFADIDWEKMYNMDVEPPFKPSVKKGKLDVSNVDHVFKRETPKDTPVIVSTLAKKAFPEFTYNEDSGMGK